MAFKKPTKPPEFADLKQILAQGRKTDSAVYLTLQEIIERLNRWKLSLDEQILQASGGGGDPTLKFASKFATYITKDNEVPGLPNSLQLIAGTGITLDTSVPNQMKISSTGGSLGNHYDAPLTDGDTTEANLIFANGECIIVQVPVP